MCSLMTSHLPLIQLDNIVKQYQLGGVISTVLNHISLTVQEGELLAIVGASGSGKSTLMNLIGLLDTPDQGTYHLAGHPVADQSDDELAGLRNHCMGFIFQQFHLLSRLNAADNVALPLIYRNIPPTQVLPLVMEALTRVGMRPFATHRPTQLSGGQQQRVAIARALVGSPRVLLADEPTGALDSATGKDIMELFLTLHKEGRTLIIVTHDKHIAAQCTRQITLKDGTISETLT